MNDKVIDTCKFNKADLPESFNKPTTMMIAGEPWRVLSVVHSGKKKITIYAVDAANEAEFDIHNHVPTRAFPFPEIADINKDIDPDLIIEIDGWRQLEFFPVSMLPLLTAEFATIEEILNTGGLLGYKTSHLRKKFTMSSYRLPIGEFISGEILENVFLKQYGYIEHGFVLRSPHNNYYGIMQEDHISMLCLENFDGVNDELLEVLEKYNMVLVDWCTPQAIY